MSQTKVSIGFDQKSREYFARLLGNRPVVAGAHCSDDDDDDSEKKGVFGALGAHCSDDGDDGDDDNCGKSGVRFGNIALGAHCGDDDEGDDDSKKITLGQIAFGAHCSDDDGDEDDCDKKHHLSTVFA